ncbi:MAG: HAMP domain-containing protein [Nitrospirae bacterium]|nr:HAMP domain-containing protein [Nitrospirota bacterium]
MVKLSITKKFFIIGLIMVAAFFAAIGITLIAARDINDTFRDFVQKEQSLLISLHSMHAFGLQGAGSTRQIVVAPNDKASVDFYKKANDEFVKANEEALRVAPPEITAELKNISSEWKDLHKIRLQIQSLAIEGKPKDAIALLTSAETPKWRSFREKILNMITVQRDKAMTTQKQVESLTYERMLLSVIIATAALLISGVIFYLFIFRQIARPIRDLTKVAKAMGEGDLSRKIRWTRGDELGELAKTLNDAIDRLKGFVQSEEERTMSQENIINFLNLLSSASEGDLTQKAEVTPDIFGSIGDAFNLMVEGLTDLIEKVRSSAQDANMKSSKILSVLKEMEENSEIQTVEVRHARGAVEDAAQSATDITEKTRQARKISEMVVKAIYKGNRLVLESMDGVQLIRVTVKAINKRMKYLSERLMEIGTISQLITEVANRTNLLAINASIEAARAGEQGKGFVVIAEEIRSLAERATKSTKQIGEILSAIQLESAGVTKHLEEETKYVEMETKLATDTGAAFKEIDASIKDTVTVISEIDTSANTQKELTSRVILSTEEVQRITREMLNLVKDVSNISASLSATSNVLISSVERFKLPETEKVKV